jgi:hypothetical protein
MHLDVTPLAQLEHQMGDVHSRAAVHLWRVFPGQESDTHAKSR